MPNEKEDSGTRLIFNTLIEYQKEVDRLNEIIVLLKKENELLSSNLPIVVGMGIPSGQYHLFGKTQSRFPRLMQEPYAFNPEMDEYTINSRISKAFKINPSLYLTKPTQVHTIEELLLMQSKGQRLTKEEKDRCIAHAEMIRKKRKK